MAPEGHRPPAVVDAAIVPVDGLTMVVVLRVPADCGAYLASWQAGADAHGVVWVTPPPCPFLLDWRIRETGGAGQVRRMAEVGPHDNTPFGIHARAPLAAPQLT